MDLDLSDLMQQLPAGLQQLWWPFCRCMALLSAAPLLGEGLLPVSVRALLSLTLAVVLLPISAATAHAVNPWSLHGVVVASEQALLGLALGLCFHLAVAVIQLLGNVVSAQLGLSMAAMNDPSSGQASDQLSTLLTLLCTLCFFALDGHLLLVRVLGASFQAFPVGGGLALLSLQALAAHVAWVFSAALLLALPVVLATLWVQMGMGLLNRIAPALNLFSMGFTLVTLFGLYVLTQMLSFLPGHYMRLVQQVLDFIEFRLKAGGELG